jgi:ABC-type nitrate/sulfonate/bicarbonate transport system substrate-binding protein
VIGLASGASLLAYRYFTRPVTLSVAVGSIDGEAAKAMSAIASRLVTTNAPVRLKVIDSGTAVVRGDVGDLSQARAVVVVSRVVVLIVAPPGSTIDGIDKLKGRRVGVIGWDANSGIVDVLSRAYGLDRAKIFKDVALPEVRQAIQSKDVAALLVVVPLAEKYLSLVRGSAARRQSLE